jgi:hypothetical protein
MLYSSNNWEWQQQIKIWIRREWRGDWILVMIVTIQTRTFSCYICHLKNVKIKIFKFIILPVVLYGCETWSQTLRDRLCLVTGHWEEYLHWRGKKWWEGGENCMGSSHKAVLLRVPVFERCINPRFLHLGGSWKWAAFFTPRPFYPEERAFSCHWIRGWVGPKPVWTILWSEDSWPYWDLNCDPSVPTVVQCVATSYRRYIDCATDAVLVRVAVVIWKLSPCTLSTSASKMSRTVEKAVMWKPVLCVQFTC